MDDQPEPRFTRADLDEMFGPVRDGGIWTTLEIAGTLLFIAGGLWIYWELPRPW